MLPPPAGAPGTTQMSLPEAESGPTIFGAIQEQLGLRLEPKKGTVQVLVVDKVEKTPTEN
jgi:uncharacterized protein (TIGR03435 family)